MTAFLVSTPLRQTISSRPNVKKATPATTTLDNSVLVDRFPIIQEDRHVLIVLLVSPAPQTTQILQLQSLR